MVDEKFDIEEITEDTDETDGVAVGIDDTPEVTVDRVHDDGSTPTGPVDDDE